MQASIPGGFGSRPLFCLPPGISGTLPHPSPRIAAHFCVSARAEWTSSRSARRRSASGGVVFCARAGLLAASNINLNLEGSPNPRGIFVMAAASCSNCWRCIRSRQPMKKLRQEGRSRQRAPREGAAAPSQHQPCRNGSWHSPGSLAWPAIWVPSRPCRTPAAAPRATWGWSASWAGWAARPQESGQGLSDIHNSDTGAVGPAQGDLIGHLL